MMQFGRSPRFNTRFVTEHEIDEARSSLLKLDVITRILALFEDADGDVRYSSVEAITKMLQFGMSPNFNNI